MNAQLATVTRAENSYSAYIAHLQDCTGCRVPGVNCRKGAALRVIHREAKRAAWPACRCPIHSGMSV